MSHDNSIDSLQSKVSHALQVWNTSTESYTTEVGGSQHVKLSARPWSRADFVRRCETFTTSKWFSKPTAISASVCAARGWVNVRADTVACELCRQELVFDPGFVGVDEEDHAADQFLTDLASRHHQWCPWLNNVCFDHVVDQDLGSSNRPDDVASESSIPAFDIAARLNRFIGV